MTRTTPEIICCGHAAYDLNFIMDEFPVEDEKYKIDKLIQTGGGPAANAATLLSRWGVNAAYAGLIGDDIYGRLIMEELQSDGVETSLIEIDGTKNTPLSAVIVNETNGSRTLLNRRNAADQPAVTDEVTARLAAIAEHRPPKVLHFDGHALDLSLKMIEMFPDAQIVMDAGSLRPATERLCAAADYAICSKRYAQELTGIDDIVSEAGRQRCMDLMRRRYAACVVVTLGADGLFYSVGANGGLSAGMKKLISLPAFKVDSIDSTAAGDIFHAAFSFGLMMELDLEQIMRFASAAAAISTTRAGGKTSIPGLDETLELAGIQL